MYKKILVTLDGSELGECVLPHVEAIAGGCAVPEIVFARVVEPVRTYAATASDGGVFSKGMAEETQKALEAKANAEAEEYLAQLKDKVKLGALITTEVLHGKPAETVAEYVANNGVDLVILSTHGRSGISRWALGSTADKLVRSVCTPVMMVRAPGCVPGI
jgi:nucleotide-binding universal stress UspA family protein